MSQRVAGAQPHSSDHVPDTRDGLRGEPRYDEWRIVRRIISSSPLHCNSVQQTMSHSLRLLLVTLALPFALLAAMPSSAAIRLTPVISTGLLNPVYAGSAGDGTGRLFIAEQRGVIKVLQPGASTP